MARPEKIASGLGERLADVRRPLNRAQFAKKVGIHENTLGGYERGERFPDWNFLTRLREILGTDLNWLISGEAPALATADPTSSGFITIPKLDIRASAGGGRIATVEAAYNVHEVVAFREDWIRRIGVNPKMAQVLTAVGDSMEPTIRDGDLLLIDRSIDHIVDNGIYVVVLGGMVLVKRIQTRRDGSVTLRSDNRDRYEDEAVPPAEVVDLIVEGRVRWFGRTI